MKYLIFLAASICLLICPAQARDFSWADPKLTVQSDIPGDWSFEEKISEFGSTLFIRAPGNYAYIALISFAERGIATEQLSSLESMQEWTTYAHVKGGSKEESKADLSRDQLKRFAAERGKEIKYSWVNAAGDKGHTITRLLMIGGKPYEYQLYCTDVVFAKEGKRLVKFLDSLKIK